MIVAADILVNEQNSILDEQIERRQTGEHLIGDDEENGTVAILDARAHASVEIEVDHAGEKGQCDGHRCL